MSLSLIYSRTVRGQHRLSVPASASLRPPFVVLVDTIASPRLASHRIASHRIASHRIASHRIASHRIASHRIASHTELSHRLASHRIASHRIDTISLASLLLCCAAARRVWPSSSFFLWCFLLASLSLVGHRARVSNSITATTTTTTTTISREKGRYLSWFGSWFRE